MHKQVLQQQELDFERRTDHVIAQLQQERAAAVALRERMRATQADTKALQAEVRATYERTSRECARLHATLLIKQRVINVLLPFYPYPISPELRCQIEL